MHRWRAIFTVIAISAVVLAGGCVAVELTGQEQRTYNATVTDVVDGDTVDVRLADGSTDRVRLLGIDTPEVHVENDPGDFDGVSNTTAAISCLRDAGQNASAYVRDRLDGQSVRLEVDETADRRGGYDRLLAYVHHDGENLNYVLVTRGNAGVYPTSFSERSRFEAAAGDARTANRGLWRCRNA